MLHERGDVLRTRVPPAEVTEVEHRRAEALLYSLRVVRPV